MGNPPRGLEGKHVLPSCRSKQRKLSEGIGRGLSHTARTPLRGSAVQSIWN